MKKREIYSLIFVIIIICFWFSEKLTTSTTISARPTATIFEEITDYSPRGRGEPLGDKGIWIQQTTTPFIIDGNLTEWDLKGIKSRKFDKAILWVAYDSFNVYVAVQLYDVVLNSAVGKWNKTGMLNAERDEAEWTFVNGNDSVVQIGFSDGANEDVWIWTASNRTSDNHAFECNTDGVPDIGVLPYQMNTNGTDIIGNVKPIYDNEWNPITNYSVIPNGTMISAWRSETITPTNSQTDVAVAYTTIGTRHNIEFSRALDTGKADDIVLNFTQDLSFYFGATTQDDTRDMLIPVGCYEIGLTNVPCELSINEVPALVTETLILTGEVYDDYTDTILEIDDSTWAAPRYASILEASGTWNIFLNFNEDDLPLGEHELVATLYGKYGDVASVNVTFEVDDIVPPTIEGLLDVGAGFPNNTAPLSVTSVTIIAGLGDDYTHVNDLTANLYYYKDEDVALAVPMIQFAPDNSTFNGNFSIAHSDQGIFHNYTYWVQVWDGNLNKAISEKICFITEPSVISTYRLFKYPILMGVMPLFFIGGIIVLTVVLTFIVWKFISFLEKQR